MIITLMITSQIPDNHHQAWRLPDFCPPCLDECTLCQLLFGSHLGYCGEMIRMLINHCNNNYILLYCCINFSHLGKNCSKILEEVVYELVSSILNPIQVLYLLNQLAWHCCTSSPIASTFPWASWAHSCQAKPTGRVSYAHLRQWIGKAGAGVGLAPFVHHLADHHCRSQMQWVFVQILRYLLWTAVTDLMLFFFFQQVTKDLDWKEIYICIIYYIIFNSTPRSNQCF